MQNKYSKRIYFLLLLSFVTTLYTCRTSKPLSKANNTNTEATPTADSDKKFQGLDSISSNISHKKVADSIALLKQDTVEIHASKVKKKDLSILAVGDLMIGTDYPNATYLPQKNHSALASLKPIVADSVLLFGNLEGVILDGEGKPKACKDPKKCYIFKTPTWLAQQYADVGFDVMSTANNHANDFGAPGVLSTQAFLDNAGIVNAGVTNRPYAIFKKEAYKIGFTAFAPNVNTQLISDTENAIQVVQKLDSLCDVVIVSFHAGAEGKSHQHITRKTEFFYNEDRGNVYKFSRQMIDAGADVLIGHGPHVPRAIDSYKNKLIIYSLGNFATYRRFNLSSVNAYAPAISIRLAPNGDLKQGRIISFLQKGSGVPVLDTSNRAAIKIKQLTKEDFPEQNILWVDDSGFSFTH